MNPSNRNAEINQFLAAHQVDATLQPLAGDASARRYFRLKHHQQSLILMDSPRDCVTPFIQICQLLNDANISAVQILAQDANLGLLLLTDLGDESFAAALKNHPRAPLFQQAVALVVQMQNLPIGSLPLYDADLLQTEMALFENWLLKRHLGIELSASEQSQLKQAQDFLCAQCLAQPQCFVHRDYHSRNIFLKQNQLHVIDFQDANCGPLCYDLVSLLRDCYQSIDAPFLSALVDDFCQQSPIARQYTRAQMQFWFEICTLQRHLKVAGIFARLFYRDGKSHYLPDIATALFYLQNVAQNYPQTQIIGKIIQQYQLISRCQAKSEELPICP